MMTHAPSAAHCGARFARVALLLLLLLLPAATRAQPDPRNYYNPDDFSSEALYATGVLGVGARAMGLAGNYTGVADDVTALLYNPAGLAQLLRIEVGMDLCHQRTESTSGMFDSRSTAVASGTGVDALAFAYPFPTYRGSLVVGFGLFRARTNLLDSARRDARRDVDYTFNDDFRRAQRDGVWRFAGGLGVDLMKSLSFGVGLSYWEGQLRDDQYRLIDEVVQGETPLRFTDRLVSDSDVDGFSFDIGLMGYVGRRGRLGLVVHSPVWLDLSGEGQYVREATSGETPAQQLLYVDQQPRLPWSLALGGSVAIGTVLVTGDLRYTAWDEIDLDPLVQGVQDPLPGASPDYSSKLSTGAGLEFVIPRTPVRLRGGFAYEPEAYDLLLGLPSTMVHDRRTWTLGGGLLLADSFGLDAAFLWSSYERADRDFPRVLEEREDRRGYLGGTYRY